VKPWRLEPLATSTAGVWAEIPEELDLRKAASGGSASAALFERGTIEALAFAPFTPRREDASARYVLAIQRPAAELMDNLRRFRFVFTSILAAALLLAALVGLLLARRLTRPLRVLRDGAMQIGRGDLSQTLDVRTGDEAEELAREFNAMAAQLRSLYQGMETTIAERTEQLQRALDDLRRAHASLGESERRYSDIVENASDLIQVTDAKGRIVSANRRETALLGIAVDAIQGATSSSSSRPTRATPRAAPSTTCSPATRCSRSSRRSRSGRTASPSRSRRRRSSTAARRWACGRSSGTSPTAR
jgi:methyl-accepting chemotaxis protein